MFEDLGVLPPDGRACFLVEDPQALPEPPDELYPYVLLTGRGSVAQWHTLTRTDNAPLLKRVSPDPAQVYINPQDAAAMGAEEGDLVDVQSRRGSVRVRATVSQMVTSGQVFMSMHYPLTNRLTLPVFDTYSRQPAYKSAAVAVRRPQPEG